MVRETNGDAIGVSFVEKREITLAGTRRQMMEEIEEFLPKNVHFMSLWGVPMSSVQGEKCALDEEGYLIIKPSNTSANMLETAGTSVNNDVEGLGETPSRQNSNDDEKVKIVMPSRPKKAKLQSTLTAYFGPSSNPAQMCTTASTRKSAYVFREDEIEEVKGMGGKE